MGNETKDLTVKVMGSSTSPRLLCIGFAPEQDITLVFTSDFKQFQYMEFDLPHGELHPELVDGFCRAMELAKQYIAGEIEIPHG